MTIPKSGKTKR